MRYRFLCCSDTHGEQPPTLDEAGATAWLHAGDLCNGSQIVETVDDPASDYLLAPVAHWFRDRRIAVHLVRGNHDVSDVYHALKNCGDLSGRIVKVAERLFIAGIGWCGERHYELPMESDLAPVCDSILRQAARMVFAEDRLILLTHYPPRFVGTQVVENDHDGGGIWYDCVRLLVDQLQPLAVVQGHNHRWVGAVHRVALTSKETLIVNPGPAGGVLEVDVVSGIARWSAP